MKSRIVNVRQSAPEGQLNIYCGRGPAPIGFTKPVELGNPHAITETCDRDKAVELFTLTQFQKNKLRDVVKTAILVGTEHVNLGCWCHPQRCHCEP